MTLYTTMHPAYFETHFIQEETSADWPSEFAIITAHATTGEKWSADDNHTADLRLEEELRGLGLWRRRLTGYSPKSGHAEPGWAVGLSLDAACDLGLRFKQDAVFYVSGDALSVSYCDHRRELVPVGEFRERVHLRSAKQD